MSELLLLRHAKSDWSGGLPDAERPLNRRGQESARLMGRMVADADRAPALVLCSPARRARLTAELAAEAGSWPSSLIEDARLCPGSPRHILQVVREHANGMDRVMVVGHEPALSQTASLLLGGAGLRMVTAAVACIEVQNWEALGPAEGALLWMVIPRLVSRRRDTSP